MISKPIEIESGQDVGSYPSETSQYRDVLAPHCSGYGIDIGFGGDAIIDSAIRVDFPQPYANTGSQSVQLGGDCRDLRWFRDDGLDYVYSSHVLEDFDKGETASVMREWVRVLRVGGNLVLLLPDQPRYVAHCQRTGQPYNEHHSVGHFSLAYVEEVAERLGNLRCIARYPELGSYSFGVAFRKVAATSSSATEMNELRDRLQKAWFECDQAKLKLNRIDRHPAVQAWRAFKGMVRSARRAVRGRGA